MTQAQAIRILDLQYIERCERSQQLREERIAKVRLDDPDIARLQAETARVFAVGAKRLVTDAAHSKEIMEQVKEDVHGIQAQIVDRLMALGHAVDYLDMHYECEKCKDTGYSDVGQTVRCQCFEKALDELCAADTGTNRHRFEAFDKAMFSDAAQLARTEKACALCEMYADEFPNSAYNNLFLSGESGLGKTFLLDCIAQRVRERNYTAMRLTAFRMFEAMRAYHIGDTGASVSFDEMLRCPMLLIDDLGTEPMFKNITIEYLFTLLNERMASGRHTVIATNLTPGQLQERYGERVLSRMIDRSSRIIRLTGNDLRIRKGQA